jgi:hypothetical protein
VAAVSKRLRNVALGGPMSSKGSALGKDASPVITGGGNTV